MIKTYKQFLLENDRNVIDHILSSYNPNKNPEHPFVSIAKSGNEKRHHQILDMYEDPHYRYDSSKNDVIRTLAATGSNAIKKRIIDHPSHTSITSVGETLAILGNDAIHNIMTLSPHLPVRSAVAAYGSDKHRNKLINDPDSSVRENVALCGNSKHRKTLENDPDEKVRKFAAGSEISEKMKYKFLMSDVRENIAKYGTDKQRDHLIDDYSEDVRKLVAAHGNESHRDQLINDSNYKVRAAVAKHGNFNHKKALWNDPDETVRKAARS